MEIGQNPIDQAYTQRPLNPTDQPPSTQQATLETGQEAPNQSVQQTDTTATSGSVGRNIDTYV